MARDLTVRASDTRISESEEERMITKGAHHVSLNVRDLEAARSFYGEMLGLPEIDRPDLGFPGVWYQAGAVQLHLIVIPAHIEIDVGSTAPKLTPLSNHLAFEIESYDAVEDRLKAAGHQVIGLGSESGQLFTRDPEGNTIEFIRPGGQVGGRRG
jgi:glyoxylase I family protein